MRAYSIYDGSVTGVTDVLGSPRLWKDVNAPFSLQNDAVSLGRKTKVFVDQNGHMFRDAPLLPLFAAVDAVAAQTGNTHDWTAVDVISDRKCLRKLIQWAKGKKPSDTFRIDVERAGAKTVLMSRWERMTAVNAESQSYGHSFENFATSAASGCEDTTAHHRIITYVR